MNHVIVFTFIVHADRDRGSKLISKNMAMAMAVAVLEVETNKGMA
jgi:hypothetical protein